MPISQIVSGGQTGVDRAVLDVAIKCHIKHGGWCPRHRRAEDGRIHDKYRLNEIEAIKSIEDIEDVKQREKAYVDERTKRNVRDSDGTLVIVEKEQTSAKDGTLLTIDEAQGKGRNHAKPYLKISLSDPLDENMINVEQWINENHISILNIGGPRESSCPGIYQATTSFLIKLITSTKGLFTRAKKQSKL